jgi:DNA ligase (NAD+)
MADFWYNIRMNNTFAEAKLRVKKLKEELDKIRYDYHVLDKETVSEAVKSSLMHELAELEAQFPELLSIDSPTQRVSGGILPGFTKITHKRPGLSLNDIFSEQELIAWEDRTKNVLKKGINNSSLEKIEYFTELKIDGLSVYLTYKKGILEHAATRGNGKIGEDVTANARAIEAIPLKLTEPIDIEVRGEVFMNFKEFERVNKNQEKLGLPTYANPRNLAAGTLRQLDPRVVAGRRLDFAAWSLYSEKATTHQDEHLLAKKLGFRVESRSKLCQSLKEVVAFLNDWEQKRKELPYQTDGGVITINSNNIFTQLGIVGKAPRGSVAWKYSAEQSTTKILDIRVNVGRTGALTPFAIMEPVKLAGTTVSRATLHNEDEINRKDIRIGDTVIVQKAGDIIPEVLQSIPSLRNGKERKFVMPKICPVCGGPVIKPEGEAVARCAATDCFAIEQQKVGHFVSRDAFNIEGVGEKIIEQLFAEGLIEDAADLFRLEAGDLEPLERFAEKSSLNLIDSINSHKKLPLNRFLYALGIRFIGAVTANDVANYFGKLSEIRKATIPEIEEIEGVGPVAARSIYEWFRDSRNINILEKLKKGGVIPESANLLGDKLAGKSFVITGSLSRMTRDEAEQKIRSLGGKASSSVSSNTNFLVVGDNPGSKLTKAEKLGVNIIDEDAMIKMIS